MPKKIEVPTEDEMTYIAHQWILANKIAADFAGSELDRSLDDLGRLQKVLDKNVLTVDHRNQLGALGIAFAQVFVEEVPNYDWWMVEDEYGRDVCIRYKNTSLIFFPESMIFNRVEDNFKFTFQELFKDLKSEMAGIIAEHYKNA